jgi:hypothetical protein
LSPRDVRRGVHALILVASLAAVPVRAEETAVPAERVALVTEFLEVTESGHGTVALRQAFVEQLDQTYPRTFEEMLAELDLSARDESAARARYDESFRRFRVRFAELFDEQIDLPVLSRLLYAPIYVRYFSDDELRELIAFYRTPTGRKSLEALPQAMTEVTIEVVPALAPLITSLVNEAVAGEKAALAASLAR